MIRILFMGDGYWGSAFGIKVGGRVAPCLRNVRDRCIPGSRSIDMQDYAGGMASDILSSSPLGFPHHIHNWKTLFVLGNGFDLQSGLESRYEDFFKDRRPMLEEHVGKGS